MNIKINKKITKGTGWIFKSKVNEKKNLSFSCPLDSLECSKNPRRILESKITYRGKKYKPTAIRICYDATKEREETNINLQAEEVLPNHPNTNVFE